MASISPSCDSTIELLSQFAGRYLLLSTYYRELGWLQFNPDWLTTFLLMSKRSHLCGWSYHRKLPCPRLLYLLCTASERRSEGDTRSDSVGGEHPVVVLGIFCDFLFLQLLPRVQAPTVVGGMRFFSLQQFAVSTPWSGGSVLLLWALLVQMAPPHHKQRGGCLQLAQTWPNCWQLWHCVRALWVLYA
jgi:hypothetical protein